MARGRRGWMGWLGAALLLGMTAGAAGQSSTAGVSATGGLAGKLTDLYAKPLNGAIVIVRNEATGAEERTTTNKNGSYRFSGLTAGDYTLEAESARLGSGRVEGITVSDGYEAHVITALAFAPTALEVKASTPARESGDVVRAPVPGVPLQTQAALSDGRAASPLGEEAVPYVGLTLIATRNIEILPLAGIPLSTGAGILLPSTPGIAQDLAIRAVGVGAMRAAMQFNQMGSTPIQRATQHMDPVSALVSTTVSAVELERLPVGGRRWQDFAMDSAASAGGASAAGTAQKGEEATVDGGNRRLAFGAVSGTDPDSGGPSLNLAVGQAWSGGRGPAVAEAAIRAVEMVAGNVEAEGARAAGGRMNVATERGGNGLHGQAFGFDRDNAWGARNPFTQWVKETAPATETTPPVFSAEAYTPADRETVFGLGMGSKIRRDKLFWFAAVDGYDRNDPGLATVKHPVNFFAQPSNDQMQVLGARLGLSSSNPVAAGLAAYSKMLETLDGLLGPAPRTAKQWVGFGRLDWQAAERHRFTLEGTGGAWNAPGGGLTRVSEAYGKNSFGVSAASEDWMLGRWEAFVTPNLLAVTQGSAGRTIEGAHAGTPSAFEQGLEGNVWGQLPQMVVDSRYGFLIGNPSRFGRGSYPDERFEEGQESLDWVRGNLLVKAGFDVRHDADATSMLRNQTGTYSYSSVENFASDALAFGAFGLAGQLDKSDQHNCDQTGKVWRNSAGELRGLGYLPCYSYYSQTMGPTNWHLSTNDWAGFATTQWQAGKLLVISAGLRWELEQLPPVMAAIANPDLPLTQRLPALGNNWGPRLSMAWGTAEGHWPVLRLGYGMYFGRTENATVETALTQTGSANGDLNFFMRPTDNLNAGGAPPFPYVLAGEPGMMVRPGAVEYAPEFHTPEVHQAVVGLEEALPAHVQLTGSAVMSLGRRLPVSIDSNFDPAVNPGSITYAVMDGTGAGPIKTPEITVPFYASWPALGSETGFAGRLNPSYQQVTEMMSRANSTYEAAIVKLSRYSRRGLGVRAHYTYAHAMDWNPNETSAVRGSGVLDPAHCNEEYGTSNLDIRHTAGVQLIYEAPWKLRGVEGRLANGWMLSGTGQYRSGLPYTMRTTGSLAKEFDSTTGTAIVGLGPGMNGSGGDNRVYGVGRNTYRYPSTWKADMRLGKRFDLGATRELELMLESFNLFNHQNVTELETTGYYIESGTPSGQLPTLNFLTGVKGNTTAFGQPLNVNATDFYRERQLQVGVRMQF